MTIDRFVGADGRVIEQRVEPDDRRELQIVRVVSLAPIVVEALSSGRTFQVFKRLASLDASAVEVGTLLLACRVEQGGVVVLGEVI